MFFLHEEEVSKSKHEALSHIRFGNNSLDKQFKRDIELISLAIVQSGPSEPDKIKADILLKVCCYYFLGVSVTGMFPINASILLIH